MAEFLWIYILFILMIPTQPIGAPLDHESSKFVKFYENGEVIPMMGVIQWFPVRSKVKCTIVCLSLGVACNGYQFKERSDLYNISQHICSLIQYNIRLYTIQTSAGISIYLHKEHADQTVLPSTREGAFQSSAPARATMTESESSVTTIASLTTSQSSVTIASLSTNTATSISTTSTSQHCRIDAALTLPNMIVLFSGQNVYFYTDIDSMFISPVSSTTLTNYLPGITGSVDGAYLDMTSQFIYIVQGTEVMKYSAADQTFVLTETLTQHFSQLNSIPPHIDDVMIYDSELIVIDNDIIYRSTSSKTVELSSNSAHNLFKVVSSDISPVGVTAMTDVPNEAAIFITDSLVYKYTKADKKGKGDWTILSRVVC